MAKKTKKKTKKKSGRLGRPKGSKNKPKTGRGSGRPKGTGGKKAGSIDDLVQMMDGRTKTITLLRISQKVNKLLDARPKPEVSKIEKALTEAEELREKYEKAMALIGG